MNFPRKTALSLVALVGFGLVALPAPAAQADSSWGCGGWCRVAPTPGK